MTPNIMLVKMLASLVVSVALLFSCVESRAAFGRQTYGIFPQRLRHFGLERSFDASNGACMHGGQLYEPNTKIVPDEHCNYMCTCSVSEEFSGFLCQPLCPRFVDRVDCGDGWEERVERVPAGPPEFRCVCEYHECVESEPVFHVLNWIRRRSVRASQP